MKFRKGFVTNSSSSSFILYFNKEKNESAEDAIRKDLEFEMSVYKDDITESVINNAIKGQVTREQAAEKIVDHKYRTFARELKRQFDIEHKWFQEDRCFRWLRNVTGEDVTDLVDALIRERGLKIADEILFPKNYDDEFGEIIYSIVKYGSDINGMFGDKIEKNVLPNIDSMIYKMSCH